MAIPEGLASYLWVGAASVLAPTVFGLGLLRWLGLSPAHGLRCALGFAYVVGHFVLAHVTLVWLWCGQPGPGCLLPVLAAALGVALSRAAAHRHVARHPASPWWSWLPLVLVAACCIDNFTAANAEPPIRLARFASLVSTHASADPVAGQYAEMSMGGTDVVGLKLRGQVTLRANEGVPHGFALKPRDLLGQVSIFTDGSDSCG